MTAPWFAAGHIDAPATLDGLRELFAAHNPGLRIGCRTQCGAGAWQGSRVCWIQDGAGEVLLPAGYRTKEGDGAPLPPVYRPEPAPPEWIEAVHYAATRVDCFRGDLRTAVEGICSRLRGEAYIGDAANNLWAWLEYGGAAPDPRFAACMDLFARIYDRVGYSVKQETGWEPVQPGDQIVATGEPLAVRGDFRYWFIETPRPVTHVSALRRLRYLKDTAGGCNFQFDAFRRMSLTWYAGRGVTPDNPDGINQLNSHYVNIARETSRAHYHPRVAVGGGKPQGELYLVLDPGIYNLNTYGRAACIQLWPDVEGANADLRQVRELPLRPGSVVYITPGSGHRGIDVFANIVVLPGYKPRNQYFL